MKRQTNIRMSASTREKLDFLTKRHGTQAEAVAVAVDRLYIKERKKIMSISIEYSKDAMFGEFEPSEHQTDSLAEFEQDLETELGEQFPHAEIQISNTINDHHLVDGREGTNEHAAVSHTIERVWRRWSNNL